MQPRGPRCRLLPALALAGVVCATSAATDDEIQLQILQPRHLSTVIGPTRVQLRAVVPQGVAIERIELSVDGRKLATLTAPPWEHDWDTGDGARGHQLEAVLHTTDGRSARSAIRTTALVVSEVERVELVNLYVIVRDQRGQYVPGLGQADFRVLEDRREQAIDRFSQTHKPLRVAIVLDVSGSMARGDKLGKAKQSALQFLDMLEPEDEGTVVAFAEEVNVVQELTKDTRLLAAAIERLEPGGGTALYDAVWRTSRTLEDFDGRRVLVLLSDGQDEGMSGLEPGSLHTLDEAVEQAVRSEVMVFPIAFGQGLDREPLRLWDSASGFSRLDPEVTLLDVLERMASETGGRAVEASAAGRLREAFDEIAEDLHNQYAIAYVSGNSRRDGKWRRIDVLTPGRDDLEIVTRKGYYAPRETN